MYVAEKKTTMKLKITVGYSHIGLVRQGTKNISKPRYYATYPNE